MRYKGKGEHSVGGLESIIEIQQEEIHKLNLQESKAPEMLVILKRVVEVQDKYFGDLNGLSRAMLKLSIDADELIKSATTLKEDK